MLWFRIWFGKCRVRCLIHARAASKPFEMCPNSPTKHNGKNTLAVPSSISRSKWFRSRTFSLPNWIVGGWNRIRDLKWGKNHDDSVLGHRHYHLLKILERRWISRVTSRLTVCQFGRRLALNETFGFSQDKVFFVWWSANDIHFKSRKPFLYHQGNTYQNKN